MYQIAAFLNLVSQTWNFAYVVHWLLMSNHFQNNEFVLHAILGWWTSGFMLIIGYLIAKRSPERGGVWSVPVTDQGATMPAAGGYAGGRRPGKWYWRIGVLAGICTFTSKIWALARAWVGVFLTRRMATSCEMVWIWSHRW